MRKVADFAEERNVDRNAVSQYIRRHGEDFKGHTKVDGHNLFFDEDAFVILDKKYPLPKPVMVIEGVPHEEYEAVQKSLSETKEQLNKSKDIIIAMKEAIAEKEKLLIQQEANVKLLEDKSAFIEKTLGDEKAEKASIQAENKALYAKIDSLNAELLEAKRPKSLIERIFGK